MKLKLHQKEPHLDGDIAITGSKSESNRLLLLQALFGNFKIKNLSNSHDSQVMQKALASCMKVDVDLISIKATTTEKLSFVGREEGVSAYAVALIQRP